MLGTNLTEKARGKTKLIEEIPISASPSTQAIIANHEHLGGVKEHPGDVKEHPGGIKEHPGDVKEHPGDVEGHLSGVKGRRRGEKRHPVENEHKAQLSAFQAALVDLQDTLLPIQAHGLLSLAKLVTARDSETLACSSSLMVIFTENLRHTDSYVYLAAIDGLVALASTMPKDIIPLLCQEYVYYMSSPDDPSKEKGVSERVQHVLKLGEALVRVARALGDILLPHYYEILLSAIMVNTRSPDVAVRTSALSNLADVCGLLHWSFGRVQNEVSMALMGGGEPPFSWE